MIIRVLMLSAIAAIGWFVFLRRNRMPFHIVTVFALLGAGAVAVVTPQTTDKVAQFVGVGRGADLITYLSLVAVLFVLIHYFSKFVELQRNLTQVTREVAILRADFEQLTHGAASTSVPVSPVSPGSAAQAADAPGAR
jgi:hypothetical protein